MSSAGRPTYQAARGGSDQGGNRLHYPSSHYSSRDLASHTKMKLRKPGQNTVDEVSKRDLKRELEERELKVAADRGRKDVPRAKDKEDTLRIKDRDDILKLKDTEENDFATDRDENNKPTDDARIKRGREANNADIDDADDSDDSDEEKEDEDNDSSSEDESDDDTSELLRELEKIKKEREEERLRKEAEKAEEEARKQTEAVLHGNPLLHPQDYSIKRKWYDDTVFKNQARDEPEHKKKRFVNDTTRNDFARKFLIKYIK
jgi:protein CWC15